MAHYVPFQNLMQDPVRMQRVLEANPALAQLLRQRGVQL